MVVVHCLWKKKLCPQVFWGFRLGNVPHVFSPFKVSLLCPESSFRDVFIYFICIKCSKIKKYLGRSFSKTAGKRFLLDFYVTFTFHWILPKLLIEYFKFTLTRFFAMKFINSMQTNVYVTLSLFIFFNFASTQNIEKAPHLFYHQ